MNATTKTFITNNKYAYLAELSHIDLKTFLSAVVPRTERVFLDYCSNCLAACSAVERSVFLESIIYHFPLEVEEYCLLNSVPNRLGIDCWYAQKTDVCDCDEEY